MLLIVLQISRLLSGETPVNTVLKNSKYVNHQSNASGPATATAATAAYANNGIRVKPGVGSNNNDDRSTRGGGGEVGRRGDISNFNLTPASVYGLKGEGGGGGNIGQMQTKHNQLQSLGRQQLNPHQHNPSQEYINNDNNHNTSSYLPVDQWPQQGQPMHLQTQGLGQGQSQHSMLSKQQLAPQKYQMNPLEVLSRTNPSVRTSVRSAVPTQQVYTALARTSGNQYSNVGHTMIRDAGTGNRSSSSGRGTWTETGTGVGTEGTNSNHSYTVDSAAHERGRGGMKRSNVQDLGEAPSIRNDRVDTIQNNRMQQKQQQQQQQQQNNFGGQDGQDVEILDSSSNRRAGGGGGGMGVKEKAEQGKQKVSMLERPYHNI